MTSFLVVVHILGCLFFGGFSAFMYHMLNTIERRIPVEKTIAERAQIIETAEAFKRKLVPWMLLAFVAWEINIIINVARRLFK